MNKLIVENGKQTVRPLTREEIAERESWVEPVDWLSQIANRRERALNTTITVSLSDGETTVPVLDRSMSLAPEAARRAEKSRNTRPFPTADGMKELSAKDLNKIADALDDYATAVWRRAGELERMVADGTITEDELDKGWPS